MKKLGTFALIGALTLGSFAATEILTSPTKASASSITTTASPVIDDWRWKTYFELHHNADYLQELAVGTLKQGATFDVTVPVGGMDVGVVKIYRVNDNDELQRFKTIQAEDAGNHYYSRFRTPITDVYTPGSYTAVLKVGENYYYGGKFTITK